MIFGRSGNYGVFTVGAIFESSRGAMFESSRSAIFSSLIAKSYLAKRAHLLRFLTVKLAKTYIYPALSSAPETYTRP